MAGSFPESGPFGFMPSARSIKFTVPSPSGSAKSAALPELAMVPNVACRRFPRGERLAIGDDQLSGTGEVDGITTGIPGAGLGQHTVDIQLRHPLAHTGGKHHLADL